MTGMTRKGMILYLDEKQLERDRGRLKDGVTDIYFRDELDFNQLNFEYEDWLHMGEPHTVTVHIYPGDRTQDTQENLESVYQHAKEDMIMADHALSYLNKKEDQ